MKKSKRVLIGLLIMLVTMLSVLLILLFTGVVDFNPKKAQHVIVDEPVVEPSPAEKRKEELKKLWTDNKAINSDYVGELMFDSGLISVPFVQAKSCYKENGEMYTFYTEDGRLVTDASGYSGNDVYIWTYWKTGEYDYNDNGGSTFMDYRNELEDQNLIVYGHHFSVWNDETRSKAFTPLEQLLEQENYAANRNLTLVLGNEIRHYEIFAVYEFNATQESDFEDLQYWRTNYAYDDYADNEYDPDYYASYIKNVEARMLYQTGVKLSTSDKTLTLQTCIGGHAGELFEIVVLKETSTETY